MFKEFRKKKFVATSCICSLQASQSVINENL